MKPLIFILTALVFFQSCSSGEKPTTANPQKNEAAQARLNELMDNLLPEAQQFSVSGKKPSKVKGKAGTEISIRPENLVAEDGSAPGDKIEVKLIELSSKADMVRSGIATVSDGRLLESGGEYYIGMESDGKALKLREGKTMDVKFPRITDKKMELFYGERDADGNINWKETGKKLKEEEKAAEPKVESSRVIKRKSGDVEDVLAYLYGDSSAVSKEDVAKWEKSYDDMAKRNRSDSAIAARKKAEDAQEEATEKARKKIDRDFAYMPMPVGRLNWLNLDYIIDADKVTDITVRVPGIDTGSIKCFMVFTGKNSLVRAFDAHEADAKLFLGIPVGEDVKIIVTVSDGDKFWAAEKPVITEDAMQLSIQVSRASEEEIEKMFGE